MPALEESTFYTRMLTPLPWMGIVVPWSAALTTKQCLMSLLRGFAPASPLLPSGSCEPYFAKLLAAERQRNATERS